MTRRVNCSLGAGRGSRGEGGKEGGSDLYSGRGVQVYVAIACSSLSCILYISPLGMLPLCPPSLPSLPSRSRGKIWSSRPRPSADGVLLWAKNGSSGAWRGTGTGGGGGGGKATSGRCRREGGREEGREVGRMTAVGCGVAR